MSPRLFNVAVAAAVIVAVGGVALASGAFTTRPAVGSSPSIAPSIAPSDDAARSSAAPARTPTVVAGPPLTLVFAMSPGFSSTGKPDASWLQLGLPGDVPGDRLPIEVSGALDQPDWSADGSAILFVARTAGGDEIWSADALGGHPKRIATCSGTCAALDDPAWSKDAGRIAYVESDIADGAVIPTTSRIVSVRADGSDRRLLVDGGPTELPSGPRWSPDGSRIVYWRAKLGPGGVLAAGAIWTMAADGSGDAVVAGTGAAAGQPDSSPDGSTIVYGDGVNIASIPVAGGTPTPITAISASAQQANTVPRWTPDGRVIFLHTPTNGPGRVMLIAATGGPEQALFRSGARTFPDHPDARL